VIRRLTVAALAACALAPAAALAHVEVLPDTVTVREATEFTIRVPTEGNSATTGVRVLFPPQVSAFSFAAPPPGWTLRPLLTRDGRFRGVIYSGGRIPPQRYADFRLLGTPTTTGTSRWAAYQTTANGDVKPWTGPPEKPGATSPETGPTQPGPAAAVRIVAEGTSTATATTTPASGGDSDGGSDAGIWLGVIAIAIAALAALGTGLLWSSRPARLPEGDEPGSE
jgi:uncharacterized protein DUF1775